MKVVSLPKLKALSIFLALALTFSVISVEPANGAAKRKTTRAVKKSSRSKSKSGRAVARGSRSSKLRASKSRRGRRLTARGRSRRSRWRRQVASSGHSSGVHKFLTQSWTQPLSAVERCRTRVASRESRCVLSIRRSRNSGGGSDKRRRRGDATAFCYR